MISERIKYNPSTGKLVWKDNAKARGRGGRECGCFDGRGYRVIRIDNVLYRAHRVAWLLHYGEWPKAGIDHIDGDGCNNAIDNLREVSQSENMKNTAISSKNKSGYSGVYYCSGTGKWRAAINIDKRETSLGRFNSKIDAVAARMRAEKANGYHENHGRKSKQNKKVF